MFNFIDGHLDIGSLSIPYYALCILTGVIIAVILGVKEGRKLGIPSDDIYLGVLIILPIAIIGARLWYILFNLDQGWNFKKIIGFADDGSYEGLAGLAIQGGVIFAFISVILYCKKKGLKPYRIFDIVAPGFFIGQVCGRWGNFCNHELFGPQVENVSLFKKLLPSFITENMRYSANASVYYHPAFLYESCLNLIGLIVVLVSRRKFKKLKSGDLVGFYLCWYGCVRIFTESLRSKSGANEILKLGPIPVSIAISVLFIITGIAFLIIKRFVGPQDYYQDILKEVQDNKFDTILFDLDGTLLDTKKLIDRSFIHTFEHFRPGYTLSDEELDSFFGPTLYQSFSRYSKDENEINQMIAYYREFNVANHDDMVKAFPGAKDVIKDLHKRGYKLGVVSSKKTDLVRHGLELCGLLEYMDIVIGSDEVKEPKPAPDGILCAKEKLNGKNVAYVGDTKNDMIAAHNANVKAIGCLYIKDPSIMLDCNCDYVINNLSDLLRICLE